MIQDEVMLAIHHLNVTYDTEVAVEDLSLTVASGEIVTLLGPTGCGKTTTLRVVAGLERPTRGSVRIGGRAVNGTAFVPPEQRRTGMVFQDFALFPHLTVAQNIGFRLKCAESIDHWLAWLDLGDQRHAYPDTLSGGQKQRVALARCLAHEPDLVLLDEPLSNLDASLKDSLRWDIRNALKAAGVPAIWVTHDQAEAMSIGDRVGVMNAGCLEQIAPPEECFQEPATRFVAEFLGEADFLPGEAADGVVVTPIGQAAGQGAAGPVEVLVRPDDLALRAAKPGNGTVAWARYEGGSRLFGVALNCGAQVRIRTHHEVHYAPGDSVTVTIAAGHGLTLFPAPDGAEAQAPRLTPAPSGATLSPQSEPASADGDAPRWRVVSQR